MVLFCCVVAIVQGNSALYWLSNDFLLCARKNKDSQSDKKFNPKWLRHSNKITLETCVAAKRRPFVGYPRLLVCPLAV